MGTNVCMALGQNEENKEIKLAVIVLPDVISIIGSERNTKCDIINFFLLTHPLSLPETTFHIL